MPRTGGVFSLLSGSKGSPNTPIQSAPYNSQLDDFAQDANLARPITAGGTAATTASGARINLGLVAVASSGSASDLTTGTLAKERLPGTQNSTNFTESVNAIRTPAGTNGSSGLSAGDTTKTGFVEFRQKNGDRAGFIGYADEANKLINHFAETGYRVSFTSGNPSLTPLINGEVIWFAGNDGAGSGLDADLLDGQQGSFYTALANATGTLADARLPSTMSSKTITGDFGVNGTTYLAQGGGIVEIGRTDGVSQATAIDFHTSATVVDYNVRLIATGNTGLGAGTLDVQAGSFTWGGSTIWNDSLLAPISQAEAQAGTGTTNRAWTAQRVAQAAKAAFPVFISAQQTFTAGGTVTVAHGLGSPPSQVVVDFVCTTADIGFSPGNVVKVYPAHVISNNGLTGYVDASNVYILMSSAGISFGTKTTGVGANITPANWRIVVRATP